MFFLNRLEESIIDLFESRGQLKPGKMKQTHENISSLLNSNFGMFVYERLKVSETLDLAQKIQIIIELLSIRAKCYRKQSVCSKPISKMMTKTTYKHWHRFGKHFTVIFYLH